MTEKKRTTARMMDTQMNDCLRLTVDKGVGAPTADEELTDAGRVFTTVLSTDASCC